MEVKITKVEQDGFKFAKITDNDDCLEFMYSPYDFKWIAIIGYIGKTKVKKDDIVGSGWMKDGKGRMSEATKQRLYIMNEYFFNNIETI